MADITGYPFVKHLRSTGSVYVQHLARGRVRHEGRGVSFWFRPLSAALAEVPVEDRELPLLFHALTADFQDVTVQSALTYRVAEPAAAAQRLDFSLDPRTGRWRGTPLEQIAALLTGTLQQSALQLVATMRLEEALTTGVEQLRGTAMETLTADPRLTETGLEVIDVRIVAVRPESDVERALQTPTRERVQGEADRATYERRATAVERERAISQNELATKVELARREAELVDRRGANARREAEEAAAADKVRAGAEADRTRTLGDAEAAAQSARLAAYADVPAEVLWALAAQELAGHLPDIDNLTLTPELLTPVLARLAGGAR
ncbi:hypothetical protein GCM10011519_28290 [Marmoricola endophyticus]|uniref:Band 7 domain-containing protein n=1 Tax=Marmoricola endophyticus TaxID=2040280 RepID=A0A917BN77_9ACTN|nr:SPFH domain-containing protein [Marmoricola endophyticus]GGF52670.1 hypothetical protein GCM10011519_28290 [Marmoricola endophyticus]